MTPEIVPVGLGGGASVAARLFESEDTGAPILIAPAMGVRATFYDGLAAALAVRGHTVLSADLRGIGDSNLRARAGADWGYSDIVDVDLPALTQVLSARTGRAPILFGHSLGGQLGCVFAAQEPQALSGIALIACCSVYFRNWPRYQRPGLWAFYRFAAQLARRMGYWPGPRFGFGGYEARTLVEDWAQQGLTGRYAAAGRDLEGPMPGVAIPILAINLSDDRWAPHAATEHLLAKLPGAPITRRLLQPAELGLDTAGHFGWRQRPDFVADLVSDWARSPAGPRGLRSVTLRVASESEVPCV